MISFTMSTQRWSDQAKRLVRETGRDAGDVLKQEGRLFLQDCVRLTPPTGKRPFSESYNVQRRAGEQAIANDIKRIFVDWSTLGMVRKNPKISAELQKYSAAGDVAKATTLLRRIGIKTTPVILDVVPSLHKSSRGAGGRTLRSRANIVLRPGAIPKYIKGQQKKVGMEKAGWLAAAQALGVQLPNWITGHAGSPGLWRDDTRSENPSLTIGNLVGYAQEHGRRLSIIKRALDRRVESLTRRLDAMLKKRFSHA